MIAINDMYAANHKLQSYGIEGYAVEKKYEQTHNNTKTKTSKA